MAYSGQPTPNPPGAVPSQPPVGQTSAFAQLMQGSTYLPSHLWDTEALKNYNEQMHEIILDNNRIVDKQRGREHFITVMTLIAFAAILAVGFTFAYEQISLGRDIVISAVSAGLGYMAGYGAGVTKKV